jgi:hypothetical protein
MAARAPHSAITMFIAVAVRVRDAPGVAQGQSSGAKRNTTLRWTLITLLALRGGFAENGSCTPYCKETMRLGPGSMHGVFGEKGVVGWSAPQTNFCLVCQNFLPCPPVRTILKESPAV